MSSTNEQWYVNIDGIPYPCEQRTATHGMVRRSSAGGWRRMEQWFENPFRFESQRYDYGTQEFEFFCKLLNVSASYNSFPNGSAYTSIKMHNFDNRMDGWTMSRYSGNSWAQVEGPNGERGRASFHLTKWSAGADFGAHFYNRDAEWEGSYIEIMWEVR